MSTRSITDAAQPTHIPVPVAAASRPFQTAETHLSWLVMVGDRVLKAKKPVWTEFLDLTTRHRRLLRDEWPPSLADHWIAYRAQVRAKVTCLRRV